MEKLTQYNFDKLCLSLWHIHDLERLIAFLSQKEKHTQTQLLTPQTFDLIFQKIHHVHDILLMLEYLDEHQLFNLENMHAVLENATVLIEVTDIPRQRYTRDMFAEVIRRCQLARGNELAARAAITAYLAELAHPAVQQRRPAQAEEHDPDVKVPMRNLCIKLLLNQRNVSLNITVNNLKIYQHIIMLWVKCMTACKLSPMQN